MKRNLSIAKLSTALLIFVLAVNMLTGVVNAEEPETATTATITNQTKSQTYTSLQDAVDDANAGDVIVIGEGVIELTTDNPTVKVTKSLTITGAGADKTTVIRKDEQYTKGLIECIYQGGVHVEISALTIDGFVVNGALKWNADANYKNTTPTDTPTINVSNVKFTNTYNGVTGDLSDYNNTNGFGFGAWGAAGVEVAPSQMTLTDCTFTNLRGGIYFEEESPVINLDSEITNNVFENIGWSCIAGIPANASIKHNNFTATTGSAIQYILNGQQTKTNTVISNNTIDSVNAIEIAPYHWNENNIDNPDNTKLITNDVLPTIENNVRNTDEYLVGFLAYRNGTKELSVFAEDAFIDLNNNYAAGKKPLLQFLPVD